jgi:hypothetical protein
MIFTQLDINLTRFIYRVENNGVTTIKKKLFSATQRFVPFEEVGSEFIVERERKPGWLFPSLLFIGLAFSLWIRRISGAKPGNGAEIFWLSLSAIFFVIYASRRKNSIYLVGDDRDRGIEFPGSILFKKRINQFIRELFQHRDNYLSGKYPEFEGLTKDENVFCLTAGVQPKDGLFLKKLTKHSLGRLTRNGTNTDDKKVWGIYSTTTENQARNIIDWYQDKFIDEGKYLFISQFSRNEYDVGLVGTTADPYKVMKYAETNGVNYDINTSDIIAKYKQWDREFGIRAVSIGSDFCECEIRNKDIDYTKLAEDVYQFCPDVVEQGTLTLERLADEMKKKGSIFLWWD